MQTVHAQHATLRAVVTHRQDGIAQVQVAGEGSRWPEEHPSLL